MSEENSRLSGSALLQVEVAAYCVTPLHFQAAHAVGESEAAFDAGRLKLLGHLELALRRRGGLARRGGRRRALARRGGAASFLPVGRRLGLLGFPGFLDDRTLGVLRHARLRNGLAGANGDASASARTVAASVTPPSAASAAAATL